MELEREQQARYWKSGRQGLNWIVTGAQVCHVLMAFHYRRGAHSCNRILSFGIRKCTSPLRRTYFFIFLLQIRFSNVNSSGMSAAKSKFCEQVTSLGMSYSRIRDCSKAFSLVKACLKLQSICPTFPPKKEASLIIRRGIHRLESH